MSDIRDDDYLRYAQALSYECLLGEIQSVRKALYGSVEGRERMRYLRRFIALVELLRSTKPPAPPVQPNGEWIQSWPNEPFWRLDPFRRSGRRDLALWIARTRGGVTLRELGEKAGGLDYSAVSEAIRRFERKQLKTSPVRGALNRVLEMLNMET